MDVNIRKIFVVVVLVALAAGFGGGIWFQREQGTNSDSQPISREFVNQQVGQPAGVDFSLFWDVWESLNSKFVDKSKIDAKKALYGAISGMVDSVGDPYTVFFEPDTSKKFKEEIQGAFGGVGIELGKRNDVLTVIAPLKDTPAFRAGIQSGDRVIKIDSTSTEGMSVEEAVNLIRGKKGTKVVLTVIRDDQPKDYELVRDTIKVPTVEWKMVDDRTALLQVYSFNENVDAQFRNAAQEILKSKATRLIVDLRNNPGGLLDSAVNLAGWFMDSGKVVTIEDFGNGHSNEFKTSGNGALKNLPTIVLLNKGSASASEILAGALHDNRAIKIVGQKSFGKGSVQELEPYNDGSSLKVTVAKWLTPNGISISEKGIEADVPVEIKDEDLQSDKIEIGTPGKDPQLDKALEVVRGL